MYKGSKFFAGGTLKLAPASQPDVAADVTLLVAVEALRVGEADGADR